MEGVTLSHCRYPCRCYTKLGYRDYRPSWESLFTNQSVKWIFFLRSWHSLYFDLSPHTNKTRNTASQEVRSTVQITALIVFRCWCDIVFSCFLQFGLVEFDLNDLAQPSLPYFLVVNVDVIAFCVVKTFPGKVRPCLKWRRLRSRRKQIPYDFLVAVMNLQIGPRS